MEHTPQTHTHSHTNYPAIYQVNNTYMWTEIVKMMENMNKNGELLPNSGCPCSNKASCDAHLVISLFVIINGTISSLFAKTRCAKANSKK